MQVLLPEVATLPVRRLHLRDFMYPVINSLAFLKRVFVMPMQEASSGEAI